MWSTKDELCSSKNAQKQTQELSKTTSPETFFGNVLVLSRFHAKIHTTHTRARVSNKYGSDDKQEEEEKEERERLLFFE
jgi:hypothetical protein